MSGAEGSPVTDYDYVIIGGGTAGCVLAARLTENPQAKVLLLEAGSARQPSAAQAPAAWPQLLGTGVDWGGTTTAQAGAGELSYPRGRVLGGSGAINAMAHIRGHRDVYDAWEAGGAAGWGFDALLPYFKRSEAAERRDPALRGTSGPVRVAPVPSYHAHPAACAFEQALTELGYPETGDLSGAVQEGTGWPDLAIADGQRADPASAYLRPALSRPNLTILDGSLVTRLAIRNGRCTGTEYLRDGSLHTARATAEVIVCAGAVGTPQLLLLSGIGPAGHLRDLGIKPAVSLPGVGENLQDHPVVMACYTSAVPLPASRYNHGEVYASLSSGLGGTWPDLQLFPILLPVAPLGHPAPVNGFVLAASVTAPDSRGTVRLASADPAAAPLIDPGFLREATDCARMAAGLQIARNAGALLGQLAVTEVLPGVAAGPGDLRDWIMRTVGSYYHPAGTCAIGPEPGGGAVVDPELRVYGVSGLRVADASVMPLIVNAPLNATVLAVAERAADLIAGRRVGPAPRAASRDPQ
jgi:choline dehydrogenase